MNALIHVPFHQGEILAVKDGRGEFVVLKPLCEQLGLDPRGQQQRVQRAAWGGDAVACVLHATGSDGKTYEMFCLHRKRLAMWLATLSIKATREEVRPYLVRLQNEAADVLDAYFETKTRPTVDFLGDAPTAANVKAVVIECMRQMMQDRTQAAKDRKGRIEAAQIMNKRLDRIEALVQGGLICAQPAPAAPESEEDRLAAKRERAMARGRDIFHRNQEPEPRLYNAYQMAEAIQVSHKTWLRVHRRNEAALQQAGAFVDLGNGRKPSLRWDLEKTVTVLQHLLEKRGEQP